MGSVTDMARALFKGRMHDVGLSDHAPDILQRASFHPDVHVMTSQAGFPQVRAYKPSLPLAMGIVTGAAFRLRFEETMAKWPLRCLLEVLRVALAALQQLLLCSQQMRNTALVGRMTRHACAAVRGMENTVLCGLGFRVTLQAQFVRLLGK
jgi:hypothetical protein